MKKNKIYKINIWLFIVMIATCSIAWICGVKEVHISNLILWIALGLFNEIDLLNANKKIVDLKEKEKEEKEDSET